MLQYDGAPAYALLLAGADIVWQATDVGVVAVNYGRDDVVGIVSLDWLCGGEHVLRGTADGVHGGHGALSLCQHSLSEGSELTPFVVDQGIVEREQ